MRLLSYSVLLIEKSQSPIDRVSVGRKKKWFGIFDYSSSVICNALANTYSTFSAFLPQFPFAV
jgi:hypothetical protein